MTTLSHHLAEQMAVPHQDRDGLCFIVNGTVEFNLEKQGTLHDFQRLRFRQWAEANGFGINADPLVVAVATGYQEPA